MAPRIKLLRKTTSNVNAERHVRTAANTSIARNTFIAKLLRVITGMTIAGVSLGFSRTFDKQSRREYRKPYGFVPFPKDFQEKINAPFWNQTNKVRKLVNCEREPPQKCTTSIDCQTRCGTDYECRQLDQDVEFNGHLLSANESYCLPKDVANVGCKAGVSRVIVSYNELLQRFSYKCKCLFPEFFSGYACDQFVACRNPWDASTTAPLVDSVDGSTVDLSDANTLRRINFHERVTNSDTGISYARYHCGCKKLSNTLTSAIHPLRCMLDPCFPLTTGYTLATGWKDGAAATKPEMNCDCGDAEETRLFGGRKVPCRPIINTTFNSCASWSWDKETGEMTCHCDADETFVPCLNDYRARERRPENRLLAECGLGTAAYVNIPQAPQAGSCINTCRFCHNKLRDSNPCVDDYRTEGICRPNNNWLWHDPTNLPFTCECLVASHALWWQVEGTGEKKCRGSKPPCRMLFGSCDPEIDKSFQGPMCCPCLYCAGSACLWIPGCIPS